MTEPTPTITPFILGDFQTNCQIVTVPGTDECWLVDCGFEPEPMLEELERRGLRPIALLLTHCHCDHIAGLEQARRWAEQRDLVMPVLAADAERGFCSDPELNLSAFLDQPLSVSEPTVWLDGGESLRLADTTWRVLATPGHSPGGLTFVHDGSAQAIVGDTLFQGSVGRVDFPTSDPHRLKRSLHDVILALPDETAIFPGHGPVTTVGAERRSNPFLQPGAFW